MNHIIGSAIKIISEVDVVTGTTMTVESIKNAEGSTVATDLAMSFDATETLQASVVWQSLSPTHSAGTYTFITKAVNGSYTSFGKGKFNIEDK